MFLVTTAVTLTQLQPHSPHSYNVRYSTSLFHLNFWRTVLFKRYVPNNSTLNSA